jgi:hypothetical protein
VQDVTTLNVLLVQRVTTLNMLLVQRVTTLNVLLVQRGTTLNVLTPHQILWFDQVEESASKDGKSPAWFMHCWCRW